MNRQMADNLIRSLPAMLKDWCKEHGLIFEEPTGTFGDTYLKVRFTLKEDLPEVRKREQAIKESYYKLLGLAENPLGKEILWGGVRYRVVELKPGRSKYPVVVARVDTGTRYKLPLEAVNGR